MISTGESRPQIRRSAAVFGAAVGGMQVLLVKLVEGLGIQGAFPRGVHVGLVSGRSGLSSLVKPGNYTCCWGAVLRCRG